MLQDWRKNQRVIIEDLSNGQLSDSIIKHVWKDQNGVPVKVSTRIGHFDADGNAIQYDATPWLRRCTLPTPELEARLAHQKANPTPEMMVIHAMVARSSLLREAKAGLQSATDETLKKVIALLKAENGNGTA